MSQAIFLKILAIRVIIFIIHEIWCRYFTEFRDSSLNSNELYLTAEFFFEIFSGQKFILAVCLLMVQIFYTISMKESTSKRLRIQNDFNFDRFGQTYEAHFKILTRVVHGF